MRSAIRVVVADDSATVRNALTLFLKQEPDIEVIGQAADGVEAVALAKALRPDVVTMDVLMPRLDGLGAIAAIMAEAPSRILVISSIVEDRQMDLSFRAMEAGALELISKPTGSGPDELRRWGKRVAESVRLMAEVPVITRRRASMFSGQKARSAGGIDVFAMAASTGGPPALATILGALPGDLPIPILIAQHITQGFTQGMVRWLSQMTPLKVKIATDGEVCVAGRVYFPPDGAHLQVDSDGLLRLPAPSGGHCPSGDKLLQSVASAYGERAGGAVLTGMGEDGAAGLLSISLVGGVTIAQDEATCVVYGMPKAAVSRKAAQLLLPLTAIAGSILEVCQPGRDRR